MRRVNVGDIEIVSLLDGTETYPASQVYLDAGVALAQYSDFLDPDDRLLLPFSSFLLRDGDLTVLVDTGNGPEVQGRLLEELREVGTGVRDIDIVVFTHLHGDHTGWNIDRGSGAAQFPNARYLVPRGDWDHYRAAVPPSVSFTRDVAALEGLGVLELIDDGHALSPSLAALHTPGHTPGHMTIVVESRGDQAYVLGDAFLTPIDVARPDWVTSWDWSAPEVRQTRRQLIERLESTNAVIAASHLPAPGLGRFVMIDSRRIFQPLT
jgi:glyoxylase-like metal-dependent hydrolase (beta-lactamase superfamily II)